MRDWLNSVLGQDGGRVAQFALALIAVILLFLLLAWAVRRLQPGARLIAAAGGKARKRLGVIEASDVDARRRLVLVRRDDVEHLIMIGGPNDLLIESRILRGNNAASRQATQQVQRPIAEAERPVAAQAAPAANIQNMSAISAPVPQGPPAAVAPRAALDEETTVVVPKPPLATASVQTSQLNTMPPPFVPPVARAAQQGFGTSSLPAAAPPVATAPQSTAGPEDPRRPSLTDLLSAAQAAKASDQHLAQPIAAPPPPPRGRPPLPDLEDDDREMPTQVVAHRSQPAAAQAVTHPPLGEFADRETEVATQIERALSDLKLPNPISEPSADRSAATAAPVRRPPQMPAPVVAAPVRPATPFVIPTMPVIAPRSAATNQSSQVQRSVPDRQDTASPTPLRSSSGQSDGSFDVRSHPQIAPEPVTAPRPVAAPIVKPQTSAVETTSTPPVAAPKSKNDELEEEMAKLLSELGGPSTR